MRKGILSLLGHKKSSKPKSKNMRLAEQAAAKKTPAEPVVEAAKANEKQFVQTIKVPKPGMLKKKPKRKHGMMVKAKAEEK